MSLWDFPEEYSVHSDHRLRLSLDKIIGNNVKSAVDWTTEFVIPTVIFSYFFIDLSMRIEWM